LESTTGKDFTKFFDDWLYGEGYPKCMIKWQQYGDSLYFEIKQAPTHPSVDYFEFPFELCFFHNNDTTHFRFELSDTSKLYMVEFPVKVDSIEFDPNKKVFGTAEFQHGLKVDFPTNTSFNEMPAKAQTSEINIYPNPVRDMLNIQFNNHDFKTIKISNILGQVVYNKDLIGAEYHQINLGHLPEGYYIIRIQSNK
jgi:hypothetical protein